MIGALTLDQLRILVAVAEEGSFSAAGRRLGRVQSAISQSVQGLEAALNVALFDRGSRSPALTEAGRVLLGQARQVLALTETLQAQAASIAAGFEPELAIAVDNLFPNAPLLASLRALRRRFPDLPVTLFTEPILASARRLRQGAADIALCGFRNDAVDLVAEPLMWIEMIPVAAPDHPLALEAGPLPRQDLQRHVQLILTDPSAAADTMSIGVISPRVWRFVELERRLDFLKGGFGWGNMPAHMVRPLIESRHLVRLELAEAGLVPQAIPISAVHRRHRPPGPAGRWFLDHLLQTCQAA